MENVKLNRRGFLKTAGTGAAVLLTPSLSCTGNSDVPSYLRDHAEFYRRDPRAAALEWFSKARFGLFMHYGLYSLLGRGEWVMLHEKIPVAEYVKLKERFTAEAFDPDFITDLALEAGISYVNLTSRHHDSFCLFDTKQTDYSSVHSPAGRDLVGELAEACARKGLGLFLYYSYAADWKHPYFYPREAGWSSARPAYDTPDPSYLWQGDEDFHHYIEFAHAQLLELLTQYGSLAGIWLDPIMGYYKRPDLFPIEQTYALIRASQSQCLISFKQGANGDEDFVAPERRVDAHRRGGEIARRVWELNKSKPREICETLQPKAIPGASWGYNEAAEGRHVGADGVMEMLAFAAESDANLLLNTGPLADGRIHPDDIATLREVGRRLRSSA